MAVWAVTVNDEVESAVTEVIPTLVGGVVSVITMVYVALSKKGPVSKLSSASIVKVDVPDEVGVPEISPVVVLRDNPTGRLPLCRAKLIVP